MQKITMTLGILWLLLLAVPAVADEGVELEIENKTEETLSVELEIRSFGAKETLTREVGVGGNVHFAQAETAHKEGALAPSWAITFHENCRYQIFCENGECSVSTGKGSCANPSRLGPRALKFVVGQ